MIESINLLDLYGNKQYKKITLEYDEKIEKIRMNSSIKKKYDDITQKCINDLRELYASQFTEEEKECSKINGCSDYKKELQNKTSCYEFGYFIDNKFMTKQIKILEEECDKKLKDLSEFTQKVKTHVAIAKSKEEVEEILTRYGILKKGILVD